MNPPIYNSHIHTFTVRHVPDRFLPLGLNRILRVRFIRRALINLIGLLGRLVGRPRTLETLRRFDSFFQTGASASQAEIFASICEQYPKKTRFIVLPMDMAYMDAGTPEAAYEEQLRELAQLRDERDQDDLTRGQVIPFCAVDPRRPHVVEEFKRWIMQYRVRGVKIYPNLGYRPDHRVLLQIYDICQSEKLPVMAHCSTGGIRSRGLSKAQAAELAHPSNYEAVLARFGNLNFCLAHFGGSEEWERRILSPELSEGGNASWLAVITGLMKSGRFPNLYTDISYTVFEPSPQDRPFSYFDYLKVILTDERIRSQVLFGTDFYMVQLEKATEKEVSIALRAHLGEELYFQLAHYNPRRYLYEDEAPLLAATLDQVIPTEWVG